MWDGITGSVDYTYNYGTAIYAAVLQGDPTVCTNIINHLANNFGGYGSLTNNGVWTDGGNTYKVLPYYNNSQNSHWKNDAGYNGICFRGLGLAITATGLGLGTYITSWQEQWARENVEAAFYHRCNATQLMWGDWQNHTPTYNLYSWDCSGGAAGMLNIPAP